MTVEIPIRPFYFDKPKRFQFVPSLFLCKLEIGSVVNERMKYMFPTLINRYDPIDEVNGYTAIMYENKTKYLVVEAVGLRGWKLRSAMTAWNFFN